MLLKFQYFREQTVSGYFHAPAALLLEISQLYPWSRRLDWIQIQSQAGRCCEKKSLLS